ncbi:NAD(P)H-dependent oxidoreductase [Pseudovibrio sp. SPO723]|uniref:NAD(P)H-dependent oxidoreductase n=1 Tax=Nesiotobacter zosterae TaxID=392721 RepID=UPI0029C44294|nr:NAD(P)H-dependent oxidoreductase [Pseudovibrio sp. SPO723]MDX5594367.1 NAD(P)H-dependent oxidoreductase [Pseudovibrio sp. SPO723]
MKTLVLNAHPDIENSKINSLWYKAFAKEKGVTQRLLSEVVVGPNYQFDIDREQSFLLGHDRIILQFPWYWYSAPAIMKAYIDQVLSYGFAYGPDGDKLAGKEALILTSTGGPEVSYHAGGYNNFSMDEFLKPFQQTFLLAKAVYLSPYVFHGGVTATESELEASVEAMLAHVLDRELNPQVKLDRLLKELQVYNEGPSEVA